MNLRFGLLQCLVFEWDSHLHRMVVGFMDEKILAFDFSVQSTQLAGAG